MTNWIIYNFLIFLAIILGLLIFKVNIFKKMNEAAETIKQKLHDSDNERFQSVYSLAQAEEDAGKIDEEFTKIKNETDKTIAFLKNAANTELENITDTLTNNAEKIILNEQQKISLKLRKETAESALLSAQEQLERILENNNELQHKFINTAINKIEEINIQ